MNTPKIDLTNLTLAFRAQCSCRKERRANLANFKPLYELVKDGAFETALFYPAIYLLNEIKNEN